MTEPRLMHGAGETLSPVDLEDVAARARRPGGTWALVAIGVATLFLAATNAVSIRDWADELAPSAAQERIADAAERWVTITDGAGFGTPRAWLHARWKRAQAARFDGGHAEAGA